MPPTDIDQTRSYTDYPVADNESLERTKPPTDTGPTLSNTDHPAAGNHLGPTLSNTDHSTADGACSRTKHASNRHRV